MKKKQIFAIVTVTAMVLGGLTSCGQAKESNSNASTVTEEEQVDTVQTTQALKETAEKEENVTGTIDEIKDFMFTITAEDGASYAFPIDGEQTIDISQFKEGDKVKVTYKGELSEIDAFTGEVLSVEKCE